MQRGIDWSVCLVPGCGREPLQLSIGLGRRDPLIELPLCDAHGTVAWTTVQTHRPRFEPAMKAVAEANQKREARAIRADVVRDQGGDGIIYFIRLNGLVKAGWTSDFFKRLRAYGPSAVVLCHYAGTRKDETDLHRQLRPSLARGREWYNDDKLIALFVENAIKRYGPPHITDGGWTTPPADLAAQPRKRSI